MATDLSEVDLRTVEGSMLWAYAHPASVGGRAKVCRILRSLVARRAAQDRIRARRNRELFGHLLHEGVAE